MEVLLLQKSLSPKWGGEVRNFLWGMAYSRPPVCFLKATLLIGETFLLTTDQTVLKPQRETTQPAVDFSIFGGIYR